MYRIIYKKKDVLVYSESISPSGGEMLFGKKIMLLPKTYYKFI